MNDPTTPQDAPQTPPDDATRRATADADAAAASIAKRITDAANAARAGIADIDLTDPDGLAQAARIVEPFGRIAHVADSAASDLHATVFAWDDDAEGGQ